MKRGAFFQHFCVSKVITTARAHKSGVIFHINFFQDHSSKKKIKKLRPKMTKIASRGSCRNHGNWSPVLLSLFSAYIRVLVGGCEIFFHYPLVLVTGDLHTAFCYLVITREEQ